MIFLTLFLEFFKIGLFCFGGAFGMIPLIEEAVQKHEWLTEDAFYNLLGVCESTPGPIAVNVATYVGATQYGFLGSLAATLGVVLPSFLIILLVASVLGHFTENRYLKGFLKGVKPVVIALILSTGVVLLARTLLGATLTESSFDLTPAIIFALLVGIHLVSKHVFRKKLPTVALILISAALGLAVSLIVETVGGI